MNHRFFAAACICLASCLAGATKAQSISGALAGPNDTYTTTFTLTTVSKIDVQTWGYAGGINASGAIVPGGGFDPAVALFQGTGAGATLYDSNDDGSCPPGNLDSVSGLCLDSTLTEIAAPPGTYTLVLMASPNQPAGQTLGDGFTGGGSFTDVYGNVRNANYAVDIVVTSASASRFVSMAPCRIVDTRDDTKPAGFGPPSFSEDTVRSFLITGGPCSGIPLNAEAFALNVTVVPHGPLGYITVWPTGQTQPTVSTLNSYDGEVKANAAIVPAGNSGAVSVFATDATDVILDINGYFVSGTESQGLAFYPLTPCRVVDTRPGAPSSVVTGTLAASSTTTVPVLSSSCDIPSTAQAYSLNFTLVPPGNPVGYLTVWPAGEGRPIVSTLNDPTGTVEANAAISPAGTAGSIDVFVTDSTDLLIDVNGYFAPVGPGALSLYTLPPCRVLDTRNPPGSPPFQGTIDVDVLTAGCGGNNTAQAYVFNATVVPQGLLGYLSLWPEGTPQPVVSTLNAYNGNVTSNMAVIPATGGQISAYATNETYLILDLFGYFAP